MTFGHFLSQGFDGVEEGIQAVSIGFMPKVVLLSSNIELSS
jgi:hypothetical protein